MQDQAWYTGSFGIVGVSYLGYTQWAILKNLLADMKTAVIHSALHNLSKLAWGTSALNPSVIL
jgi:predicted acyl esterase